jgi:amidase
MDFAHLPFDPRIVAVVDSQRSAFESIGCCVEDATPDFAGADEIFLTLRARAYREFAAFIREHWAQVKDTIHWEITRGERISEADVAAAEQARSGLRHRIARFMERHEFLVLPTTQVPPFDVNEEYVREINGVRMETYVDWMKSCYFISAIGHPAISVPAGLTAEGLPVGLQIVGRDESDWDVLDLARAYEAARGPFPEPPMSRA